MRGGWYRAVTAHRALSGVGGGVSEMVWGGPGWGFVTQGIHISGRAREKCAAKPQTDETFCDPGSQTEAFCDPGLELIPGQAHLR